MKNIFSVLFSREAMESNLVSNSVAFLVGSIDDSRRDPDKGETGQSLVLLTVEPEMRTPLIEMRITPDGADQLADEIKRIAQSCRDFEAKMNR